MNPHTSHGISGMGHDSGGPSFGNQAPIAKNDDAYFAAATARSQIQGLRDIGIRLHSRRIVALKPIRGAASAYIDGDTSGTYDPNKSPAKSTNTPRRNKKGKRDDGEKDASQVHKTRRCRRIGYSLPISIVLTSEKGLEYLRSITPGPFEEDGDSTDTALESSGTDDGILILRRQVKKPEGLGVVSRADGVSIEQLTDGHPQRRGCKSCFEPGDDGCSLIENAFGYPCVACDDASISCELIVPPEFKRVCERCKKKRVAYSYRLDGGKGIDACAGCKEAGVPCYAGSLRSTHSKRFQGSNPTQADVSQSKAHSAPSAGLDLSMYASQPITSTQPVTATQPSTASQKGAAGPSSAVVPERLHVACNQCRTESLRCNLKRHQTGPCKNCLTNNETCKFVLIPPPNKRNRDPPPKSSSSRKATSKRKTSKNKSNPRKRSIFQHKFLERVQKPDLHKITPRPFPRPFHPPQPRSTEGITHIHIRTSFVHPITFNHVSAPDGSCPCSWCASPFFGLFGHGEREIEVIPWPNGQGYEEIETEGKGGRERQIDLRGHNHLGEERSRMCVSCTFERVRIMVCDWHEMRSMEDVLDSSVVQGKGWDRAVTAFESGDDEGSRLVQDAKWCSACPAFAEYRCVASQVDFEMGEDGDGEGVCGCGLFLCENCKDLLGKIEREKGYSRAAEEMNVLDQLVHMVGKDKFHYPIGARADASFLTTDGELNSRLVHGFAEDVDSGDSPGPSKVLSEKG